MHFSHAPGLYSRPAQPAPMLTSSAVLVNPNKSATDLFGFSAGISGNYAVVGAYREDTSATDTGQAYVFNITTGALVSTLVNPNPSATDGFGWAVSISGNRAGVSATYEDIDATDTGRAYIFDVTTGALVSTLVNPNPTAYDYFGVSVAIGGNYAVVGAHYEDVGGVNDTGQAYVFTLA